MSTRRRVVFGNEPLTLEDLGALAQGTAVPVLSDDPALRARVDAGAARVKRAVDEGEKVYGVTTGYGASVRYAVEDDAARALPLNLLRYHGCGTGARLPAEEAAAVVATRLASLVRGYSGVRWELLERLVALLAKRVLPVIPEEGSVGASGDLTPLSYLAAVLVGEREVLAADGSERPARAALEQAGIEPVALAPKETLALLNGTSVMNAIAGLAWLRADRLFRLAAIETAMCSTVLDGPAEHFDEPIHAVKGHACQLQAASWIRGALPAEERLPARVQDVYSIRCAPHVLGVGVDALAFARRLLETEIHGVSDNPLIFPEEERPFLHGGNFYGGHPALASDLLKNVVANLADLLDRQLSLLCNPQTNHELPANLVAREGEDRFAHHGFKAMEITASALTAEALKLAGPTSVFSRSTESHNQDKVSMGTIAAREARRVVELAETVAAIHLLALAQAADIRARAGQPGLGAQAQALVDAVRAEVPTNLGDRRMDHDIAAVLELLRSDRLPLPAGEVREGALPTPDARWASGASKNRGEQ